MRRELIWSIAALFFVAACQSAPDEVADVMLGDAAVAEAPPPLIINSGALPLMEPVVTENRGPLPETEEYFVVEVGDRVFFGFDDIGLSDRARETLQRQATWLRTYPGIRVVIEGHTDERGTREYNLALGERRANSVLNYLVALGIDASRLETISYGKERPVALGSNETAWALNRRAVTVVIGGALAN
jgi:peptidoglycan-associated lipoprotein